ncbi:MAG: undecaprenyl-diphosphatase UppP [Acidobacteria bacterium]|nr:undecaprenyl-diphosphatase UppP [Acidobacteriota bacterium]MCW5970617.1 undecaprenyl-diphosphatase UppP [Blastocatellales bacterium]
MTLLQAIILGIIQGLTEFIPISSSGHLILAQKLMGLEGRLSPEQITAFIAVIQLGTLAAVIIYFLRDILAITFGFVQGNFVALRGQSEAALRGSARLGWLIIIGSLPIAGVGLGLKEFIEGSATKNLYLISGSLIVWALLLALAEMVGRRRKDMADLGVGDAIVVGVAQVFALIPGSSRSGTTITGALFAGINREAAARFSFLLSIPAIAASGLLELREALAQIEGIGTMNLIVSTAVSGVVGYASIAFLLAYLRRRSTALFIVYRLLLGAILLALLYTGRIAE